MFFFLAKRERDTLRLRLIVPASPLRLLAGIELSALPCSTPGISLFFISLLFEANLIQNTMLSPPRHRKYDLLKYIIPVRRYMMMRHNLTQDMLETLLSLYSERIFTYRDSRVLKAGFGYSGTSFLRLVAMGHIQKYSTYQKGVRDPRVGRSTYQLSSNAKKIVTDFYKYLSGEKTIPEVSVGVKSMELMLRRKTKYFDLNSIRRMNEQIQKHIEGMK